MNTKFYNALRRSFRCEITDTDSVLMAGVTQSGLVAFDRGFSHVRKENTWVFTHYGVDDSGEYQFHWSTYDLTEEQAERLLGKRLLEGWEDAN